MKENNLFIFLFTFFCRHFVFNETHNVVEHLLITKDLCNRTWISFKHMFWFCWSVRTVIWQTLSSSSNSWTQFIPYFSLNQKFFENVDYVYVIFGTTFHVTAFPIKNGRGFCYFFRCCTICFNVYLVSDYHYRYFMPSYFYYLKIKKFCMSPI